MNQSDLWIDPRCANYSGGGVTKRFIFIWCAFTLVVSCVVSVGLSTVLVSGQASQAASVTSSGVPATVPEARPASVEELKQRVAYLEREYARLSHDMAGLMGGDGVLQRVIDRLRVLQGRDEVLRQNVVDILTGATAEPGSLAPIPGDPSYDSDMLDARMQPEGSEPLMTRARHSLVTPVTAPAEAEELAAEETQDDPGAPEQAVD